MDTAQSRTKTLQQIAKFLTSNPESSARKIAAELGVDKTSINSILYSNRKLFDSIGDKPPLWSIKIDQELTDAASRQISTERHRNPKTADPTNEVRREFIRKARESEASADFDLAKKYYEKSRKVHHVEVYPEVQPRARLKKSAFDGATSLSSNEQQLPAIRHRIENLVKSHPGITMNEVEHLTGLGHNEAIQMTKKVRYLISTADTKSSGFSELQLQLLDGISLAGTMEYPVSSDSYDDLVRRNFIFGRSSARIIQIFGSWRRACELAGVEAPEPYRDNYEHRWTDRELAEVVARFLQNPNFRGALHRYAEWRSQNLQANELPSAGTLKNYLGPSWSSVRNRGLEILRESWLPLTSERIS